ncbi:chemotaxis response regulator protein-glutamate methylesterase [Nocardioides albidus]|uniref:Protein-glutamate methylesterase/protein-glutamine glutaminase n=1 Tax=Nocardioides albidus TaxID=1517589 RepID=A0A5C4W7V2_9ACTN|nr:chemotaxis response regulator protein-glutamate methylesterase [Nocardioides albidus]
MLVVDDSALVRRLVTTALRQAPDIEVAGVARDGLEAVRMVGELRPDVVTLDIEMPNLDGLGALTQIRDQHPRLPVIMFSTLTERGATATLDALSRGASDYVTKPSNTGQIADGIAAIRDQLVPRIRALAGIRKLTPGVSAPVVRRERPALAAVSALLIGCSTGGPDALARLLPRLPADLGVPVLVVQHMPPVFTTMLAQRLDKVSALTVREAVDGEPARPGEVLIAPGDFHMRLRRSPAGIRVALDQGPQENFCRPAVDVLFRSAVEPYGAGALAAVLTGMGQDGLAGARDLAATGARILVQDEESSVVWGMPGAVAGAGLADDVLPLDQLADRIIATVRRSRAA